jgi:hypothetical protein
MKHERVCLYVLSQIDHLDDESISSIRNGRRGVAGGSIFSSRRVLSLCVLSSGVLFV